MGLYDQLEFDIRCEWGLAGLRALAPVSDVVIVVDVLSFSTAVDIATSRGAVVFPYPLKDASAAAYVETVGASLASPKRESGFSLSPASLLNIPAAHRLVLPSPNGGALCFAAQAPHVLTACFRNASAAAAVAARLGSTIGLVPAGEIWDTGEMRPSLEDLAGAGSVIARLRGRRSPEAELAVAVFDRFRADLGGALRESGSGKELIARGFSSDVDLAAEHDISRGAPLLADRAFRSVT